MPTITTKDGRVPQVSPLLRDLGVGDGHSSPGPASIGKVACGARISDPAGPI